MQLQRGIGSSGDQYEQHADAVADLVVEGESAEPLLDRFASDGSSSRAHPGSLRSIQRKDDDKNGSQDNQCQNDGQDGQTGDKGGLSPRTRRFLAHLGVTASEFPPQSKKRLDHAIQQLAQLAMNETGASSGTPLETTKIQIVEDDYQFSLEIAIDHHQKKLQIALAFQDTDGEGVVAAFEHSAMPLGRQSNAELGPLSLDRELPGELQPPTTLGQKEAETADGPSPLQILQMLLSGQEDNEGGTLKQGGLCVAPELEEQPDSGDDGVDQALQQDLHEVQEELDTISEELALAIADGVIDAAGIFDPTPISDGIAAARDLYRGDWLGAGLSVISMVPYVGDAVAKPLKGARIAKRLARLRASLARLEKRRQSLQKLLEQRLLRRKAGKLGKGGEELAEKTAQKGKKKLDEATAQGDQELAPTNGKNSGGNEGGGGKEGAGKDGAGKDGAGKDGGGKDGAGKDGGGKDGAGKDGAGDGKGAGKKGGDGKKGTKERRYKRTKSGISGKEGAKDVPDWARGQRPFEGENGKKFAKRVLDEKYGPGNYPTGPGSEYNKIKKWGDRSFEDP